MSDAARVVGGEQVAEVFRALADEHCEKRAALEQDLAWRCIASRARERARRRAGWWSRLALPAAAALCIVCAVLGWSYRPALEYDTVGAASVRDGEIRAGLGGASLVFSDGSTVEARESSQLTVSVVGQQAALTRLLRGALSVSVRHDERSDWRFLAGPYEVRVVGTKFDLSWEPEASLFTIVMHQGSVRVTGPGKFDRTLSAGETLERSGIEQERRPARDGERVVAPEPVRTDVLASSPVLAKAARHDDSIPDTIVARRALRTPTGPIGSRTDHAVLHQASPLPPEDDWPLLVARGKFEEVVEAVVRADVDAVLAANDVADLKALAQAARYTGNTPLALRAWMAIRSRFGGHAAAQQAAFFSGRIYDEMDERGLAKQWLDTYLAEAPEGVYASEALGRRLGLARRMSDRADVERLARSYLERFPSGPYARTARGVLSVPASDPQ